MFGGVLTNRGVGNRLASMLLLSVGGLATAAHGQTTTNDCPPTATSCSVSNQTIGDTSNPSSATDTNSTSSLSGTSSASNASGVTISPEVRAQSTQNSTNTTTGTITGGNTTGTLTGGNVTGGNVTGGNTASTAQGGASTGNVTNASTGPSTSTSGGNTLGGASATTGNNANTSSVGNTTTGPSMSSVGNVSGGPSNATSSLGSYTSNLTGGPSTLTGGAQNSSNTTGASNSSTTIDAADRSVYHNSSRVTFIPPVVPPTPPSVLGVGNIVKETGSCGPLQHIVREPVNGTYFGIFKRAHTQQGFTEHLEPFIDERGVRQDYRRVPVESGRGYHVFGHQVTQYTTVLGIAGAGNLAIGGGGGGGGWGQGGVGSSSSMQQMVTTIQLRECEIGTYMMEPEPVRLAPVYVEPKRIRQ